MMLHKHTHTHQKKTTTQYPKITHSNCISFVPNRRGIVKLSPSGWKNIPLDLWSYQYTAVLSALCTILHKKCAHILTRSNIVIAFTILLHSHQIKIATDWLQTGSWLALDSKIGVNGTMLYQCNPTSFYQSEASWKPVWSQSVANLILVWTRHMTYLFYGSVAIL